MPISPENDDALREFVRKELRGADLASLVRQVQGSALFLAAPGGAQRKAAFGAQSLTWTASVGSAIQTVTHGLGVTPTAVIATGNSGGVAGFYCVVSSVGATTFDLQGIAGSAISQTLTAYWIAVG